MLGAVVSNATTQILAVVATCHSTWLTAFCVLDIILSLKVYFFVVALVRFC